MLKKFIRNNDIHREKVINYIKDTIQHIEKFKIEEFNQYPGGIALIDSNGRKIIIYDNFLINQVEEIYEECCDTVEELTGYVYDVLWKEYQNRANYLKQIARLEKDKNNNISFYRYEIKENENLEKIHASKKYNCSSQLYDIKEYLELENKNMKEEILKRNEVDPFG